jgi:hypothetical protein
VAKRLFASFENETFIEEGRAVELDSADQPMADGPFAKPDLGDPGKEDESLTFRALCNPVESMLLSLRPFSREGLQDIIAPVHKESAGKSSCNQTLTWCHRNSTVPQGVGSGRRSGNYWGRSDQTSTAEMIDPRSSQGRINDNPQSFTMSTMKVFLIAREMQV